MALSFMFPRARRSEPRVIPAGTFEPVESRAFPTKSDVAPRPTRDSAAELEALWEAGEGDVFRITLPPDAPRGDVFPNIEAALLAATEQLQRTPSQPELPPIADLHRRSKID
jgi:hypothetical protein